MTRTSLKAFLWREIFLMVPRSTPVPLGVALGFEALAIDWESAPDWIDFFRDDLRLEERLLERLDRPLLVLWVAETGTGTGAGCRGRRAAR